MSDVTIQCLSCGNEITVSDVVNIENLKCRACGGDFLRSNAQAQPTGPTPEEKRRSLMKTRIPEPVRPQQASEAPPANHINRVAWEKLNDPAGQAEVQKQSAKMYSSLTWKAWAIFIGVGAIAGTCRYSGLIPASVLRQAILYEALTVLILHIFIVLKAFKDSILQGVLCVLLPPYSLYYLFSASDDFYLRAFIAGLLIGIGQDAGVIFHEWSIGIIDSVNGWIASGG